MCKERNVNLKERKKNYNMSSLQSREIDASHMIFWGILTMFLVQLCGCFFP